MEKDHSQELKTANDFYRDKLFLCDTDESLSGEMLTNLINYYTLAFGCEYIILDHITLVCSDLDGGRERTLLDDTMKRLKQIAKRLNIGIFIVTHLRRLDGNKGHEDGMKVRLSHLRGSGGIAQISNCVIALQGSETDKTIEIEILKNRYAGKRGVCDTIFYNEETCMLTTWG